MNVGSLHILMLNNHIVPEYMQRDNTTYQDAECPNVMWKYFLRDGVPHFQIINARGTREYTMGEATYPHHQMNRGLVLEVKDV